MSTTPFSTKSSNQKILTPERARRWHKAALPAVLALRSGTQACAIIIGESPDRGVLLRRDAQLKEFKIRLVQRELVIECYRLLGNKRPDFSLQAGEENIVGRNTFYKDFLLKKQNLLGEFLFESWTNLSITPILITDLLNLINPVGNLKDANSLAHDISYSNVWQAISLMKEVSFENGEQWERLAVLVTDNEALTSWEANKQLIKPICQVKRERMQSHILRREAEDFESMRVLEQRKRLFKRLERQGIVVTPESLFWWKITVVSLVVLVALILIFK